MRVYVYPWAKFPVHDNDPVYANTVPMSPSSVNDTWVNSSPEWADYFYMGQFNDTDSLDINPEFEDRGPHFADIEGDWFNKEVPKKWLSNYKLSINGFKSAYRPWLNNVVIRPTFSKQLMSLVKLKAAYRPCYNRSFSFTGFHDPLGIRIKMKQILDGSFRNNIKFTDRWLGSSNDVRVYHDMEQRMINSTFSLCPRGTGVDSVRFLESCFYGRIPIVISDNVCFGHDYEYPFYFQCDPDENSMGECFYEVSKMSIASINEYSRNAVRFFNTYVKRYFQNPTQFFWDKINGL